MSQRRDPQWLRGVLPLCILSVLTGGEQYGYDLSRKLEEAGLGSIKGGTLYPVLGRLEADGLVAIRWESGGSGPSRKYYRLTDEGRTYLGTGGQEWLEFNDNAARLLRAAVTGAGR